MFIGNLRIDLKLSNVNETWSKDQKIFIVNITKYCVNINVSCVL